MEITPEVQALLDAQKETLTAEFDKNVAGLKQNVEDWRLEKEQAKSKAEAAAQHAANEALETAKAKGDIVSVTESYDEKVLSLQAQIESMNADNLAKSKSQLASDFLLKHGTGDQLGLDAMKREYEARLDIRDGKQVVLDPEGNLTALSVEDLNKEFIANSRYDNHIKGTQAAGGGANGSKGVANGVSDSHKVNDKTASYLNMMKPTN